MTSSQLAETEIPERLRQRPQHGGMAVPYTTLIDKGVPDFKVMDDVHWLECLKHKLCALCGEGLEYWCWYIGTMNHIILERFVDMAMHEECARYAAKVCRYMAYTRAYSQHLKEHPDVPLHEYAPAAA